MKTTSEKLAELKRLAKRRVPTAGECETYDLREAVRDLIADLEEAQGLRASGNMILVPADRLREMQAKLAAAEKDVRIADLEARIEKLLTDRVAHIVEAVKLQNRLDAAISAQEQQP